MIYFIQDQSILNIKIGYTGSKDAQERLAQLQTGSPSGLVLLHTMSGERVNERSLHEQFAAARVQGEWFRPVPELLQFILEIRASDAAVEMANALEEERRVIKEEFEKYGPIRIPPRWPLSIYLAGKIEQNCWRHTIVKGLRSALSTQTCSCPGENLNEVYWPILHEAIFETHHYVGPFFFGCDHGCYHGDSQHGAGASLDENGHYDNTVNNRRMTQSRCLAAIKQADLLFAWIDDLDCYGTITEIGYAKAIGKTIWIAGPRRYADMWFVYQSADKVAFGVQPKPETFLRRFLSEYASSNGFNDDAR